MANSGFSKSVFVNCPFDADYAPLLEACLFCIVYFGFQPRLANESLEAGQNRLDKIGSLISGCMYSVHDLSRARADRRGDFFRMNMPFEFGMDVGFRKAGGKSMAQKKFVVFEENQYDLKQGLSDTSGQDVMYHSGDYERVIKGLRDFFKVEAGVAAPGPSRLISDYATFQAWMVEKKISEGHSESEAVDLPTAERLGEMQMWVAEGKPAPSMAKDSRSR